MTATPSAARPEQVDLLAGLLWTTRGLVARVTPGDRPRPTPCTDLDLGALVAHVIGWQQVFAACLREVSPPIVDGSPTYRPSDHLVRDLDDASHALLTALAAAAAEVELPYRGRTPIHVLVAELIAETALHAWDVATAMNLEFEVDQSTVAAAHEGLTLLLSEPFAERGFRTGAPVDGAPPDLDTLLRRSGRDPAQGPAVRGRQD
jgi:uncharacterized protein (TIGR03086 family)